MFFKNHVSFWHLAQLWTGKSDKSSKIINPQSVRLSSNSMLNLTKGRRSAWALQPSAKGVTGVVSHYSSYPASFREFLAPDAPEHSLLVNTSLSLNPTCTLGHTCTHKCAFPPLFFHTNALVIHLSMTRETLIPFIVKSYSKIVSRGIMKTSYYSSFKQSCIHSETNE